MRAIDADRLLQHFSWWSENKEKELFTDIINAQPSIAPADYLYAFASQPTVDKFRENCMARGIDPARAIYSFIFAVAVGEITPGKEKGLHDDIHRN